jgi:hypothetical protein
VRLDPGVIGMTAIVAGHAAARSCRIRHARLVRWLAVGEREEVVQPRLHTTSYTAGGRFPVGTPDFPG